MELETGPPFSAAWLCFAMGLAQSCGIEATFDEAIAKTIAALKAEGFGVLSDIDVSTR